MPQAEYKASGQASLRFLNAGSLLRPAICVSPDTINNEVLQIFTENSELIGLPVIENDIPIGIINRHIFMNSFARPFYHEIYGRKSCIAFMDKEPVIVEQKSSIQEISEKVIEAGNKALTDGFIITDRSKYIGVGIGYDLVKAVAELYAEKNRALIDSINYASVIQKAMLGVSREAMGCALEDYFICWQPRDVVGGDFYKFIKFADGYFVAVMDCTGHGVPGAFITMIISSVLGRALSIDGLHTNPAGILEYINKMVKVELNQVAETNNSDWTLSQSDDGMDAAACWVDLRECRLIYSGARMPLFYLADGEDQVIRLEGERKGIGYIDTPFEYRWTNQEVPVTKGEYTFYMVTDGILDQIGGKKRIGFGKRRFQQLMLDYRGVAVKEQGKLIMEEFLRYQGKQVRRDDATLLGWRF